MKRKFKGGKPPIFGRRGAPKSINYWRRSPWYWWFEYLRRCDSISERVSVQFGDVRAIEFKKWWTTDDRGGRLFGEPMLEERVELITSLEGLAISPTCALVRLPLSLSQKYLKRRVAQLLRKVHRGKRGIPALRVSQALYPLEARCDARALEVALSVWDLRQEQPQLRWWEIGQQVGVIATPDSKLRQSDSAATLRDKKNALANVAHRYFKRADAAIRNAGEGRFPDYRVQHAPRRSRARRTKERLGGAS